MGYVKDYNFFNSLRFQNGQKPCHYCPPKTTVLCTIPAANLSPIMSNDESFFFSKSTNDFVKIFDEKIHSVVGDPLGFITIPVSSHVNRDDTER